jgi:O-antigen/teichoic acid export membrane protein
MQTDVVMVGAILGPRAAGLYGAAAKTASLVGLVLIAVNAIAAPIFSSLFAQGRHEDVQRLASDIAEWIFWPSLFISVLLAIFSKPILGMFGSEFSAAHWQLTILLVGQVVSAGAGSVGWLMLLTGHQDQAAWVYGWIALIHVALLGIAIPLLGTTGAALATTASFSLWNVWLHALVVRKLDIHPSVLYALRSAHRRSVMIPRG